MVLRQDALECAISDACAPIALSIALNRPVTEFLPLMLPTGGVNIDDIAAIPSICTIHDYRSSETDRTFLDALPLLSEYPLLGHGVVIVTVPDDYNISAHAVAYHNDNMVDRFTKHPVSREDYIKGIIQFRHKPRVVCVYSCPIS